MSSNACMELPCTPSNGLCAALEEPSTSKKLEAAFALFACMYLDVVSRLEWPICSEIVLGSHPAWPACVAYACLNQ